MAAASNNVTITATRTFRLAVGVLIAFFSLYGYALVTGINPSPPHDFTGIEKIASTLSPIAAAVIGYYFGQRPIGEIADKLKSSEGDASKSVQKFQDSYDKILSENKKLKEQLDFHKQAVEQLRDALSRYEGGQSANQ